MSQSTPKKIGRNNPCTCGSGRKYKGCCGSGTANLNTQQQASQSLQIQAQQAVARGDFSLAVTCYRQLHALKPEDVFILASLGQALCWVKRRREGLRYLFEAAKFVEHQITHSRDPKFAIDLAGQLLHWGEARIAEKLTRLALIFAPSSAQALHNLVMCLTRVNRYAEALPYARQVCMLLPKHPGCNILLAIIESQLGYTVEALKRLDDVIKFDQASDQTARAWLESGVILDKLGRYEEAFTHLTSAAKAHTALLQPTDIGDRLFNTLRANTQGFDAALLKKWPANDLTADGLPSPAFLMGFLRSGTTLTERILDAHPSLMTTDESSIVFELTQQLQAISGGIADHSSALKALSQAQIMQLRQYYWQRMREEYGDAVMHQQVIDKNALNTIDLGVISVIFPEAKIIFALRDPRDISISCFMQAFTPSQATINLLSLEGIAKQYAAVMDYWLQLRGLIQPHYLELRYEDTVNAFEASYRRVFAFLGVEWVAEVAQFHEQAHGRYISTPSFTAVSQPLYNKAVARWRHYQKQLQPILPVLAPYVASFGYE